MMNSKEMKMQYALFAGSHYYPSGGMNDCRGRYVTIELARDAAQIGDEDFGGYDWYQIVDLETFTVVEERQ
jgi:hypothetical protein